MVPSNPHCAEPAMNDVPPKPNILFVMDDRDQVVSMWRNELGLTCFQVAEGDF